MPEQQSILLASRINELWLKCLTRSGVVLSHCPSNEDVAKLIEEFIGEQHAA